MELEKMKKNCNELDGIFCYATQKNYELLLQNGFKQWGSKNENDIIYAIDKEDDKNEFVPLLEENIEEYRRFIFKNNKPIFK